MGNHFAMLEGVLMPATLVQMIEVRPRNSVTLRPTTGVWLEVRRRG